MNPFVFFAGLLLGIAVGYAVVSYLRRPKFLAISEFWVFLPTDRMPTQDAVMDRMIRENPYGRAIGPAEGLIFSDIRLAIGLVKRDRNPSAFMNPEFVDEVRDSPAFVRLRYISCDRITDRRHLQFLFHAADAYCALGGGVFIWDEVARKSWPVEELKASLKNDANATDSDRHVAVEVETQAEQATVRTFGLAKMGLPEIFTREFPVDMRMLMEELVREAVAKLWREPEWQPNLEVEAYDDRFILAFDRPRDGVARARIMRLQRI